MTERDDSDAWSAELHRRAEARLAGKPIDLQRLSPKQAAALAHDLQVHQIELEMQNEELLRTQEELAATRDRFIDLYDYAPVAYVTTETTGTIISANLTASELFGVAREHLLGAPLSDLVSRQSQDTFYLHHREIHNTHRRRRCELTMVRADGGTFPAQLDTTITSEPHTGSDYCRTMITDITERMQADEALARLRHRESLCFLAAGIAHDFNNLLTTVLGAHSMATMDLETPERLPGHLGVMREGLNAIRDLVRQLLNLAAPISSEKGVVSTRELVETGCRVSTENVHCECTLAPDLWPIIANEPAVSRVIQNLVTNAAEAMPSGGVVRIAVENAAVLAGQVPHLQPGRYVHLSVADAGVGISREELSRIFDPYFSTKPRGGDRGTGLGLAICHATITEHGGAITVDSTVGAGTTFHVHLPAAEEPAPVPHEPPDAGRLMMGKGHVLVMDDHVMVRLAAGKMLERLGYSAATASDGAEAVKMYRTALKSGNRFTAVILDLTVPGGTGGKEALQKILAIDPEATVLISSGYIRDPVVTDYARHGFCGALPKPYDMAELDQALHAALHRD